MRVLYSQCCCMDGGFAPSQWHPFANPTLPHKLWLSRSCLVSLQQTETAEWLHAMPDLAEFSLLLLNQLTESETGLGAQGCNAVF